MLTFQYARLLSLLLAVVATVGCASRHILTDAEQPVAGRVIVFGQVDVEIEGEIQDELQEWADESDDTTTCFLMILPPEGSQAITYQINDDGVFFWNLAPGDYELSGFRCQKGALSQVGIVAGSFTVPEDADAIYIGNIQLTLVRGRHFTVIEDKADQLTTVYQRKFPSRTTNITAGLLQLPAKLGTFTGITSECCDRWGVDCTGQFRGVTPVTPIVKPNEFRRADSLTPVFSWEAAEGEDVSYDLIVYEAARYGFPGINDQLMKGRMVVYQENIPEARFQLSEPLRADSTYYWSVRLRKSGVVSRWSTYSHFGFYVFYTTSGYGQWFAFSTP